jgi:hypothetical protein
MRVKNRPLCHEAVRLVHIELEDTLLPCQPNPNPKSCIWKWLILQSRHRYISSHWPSKVFRTSVIKPKRRLQGEQGQNLHKQACLLIYHTGHTAVGFSRSRKCLADRKRRWYVRRFVYNLRDSGHAWLQKESCKAVVKYVHTMNIPPLLPPEFMEQWLTMLCLGLAARDI